MVNWLVIGLFPDSQEGLQFLPINSDPRESALLTLREASASSAMRLSARRSRRQSSRLIFCITITYA